MLLPRFFLHGFLSIQSIHLALLEALVINSLLNRHAVHLGGVVEPQAGTGAQLRPRRKRVRHLLNRTRLLRQPIGHIGEVLDRDVRLFASRRRQK